VPTFAYRGRRAGGELVQGLLEGNTATAVADILFGTGVTPLEIHAAPATSAAGQASRSDQAIAWFAERVGHVEILLFTRQLHTLLKAGVPIMRALSGLQDSSQNEAMKRLLGDVRQSLESGHEFSASLSRHPRVFSSFYLAIWKRSSCACSIT
jgi:MSHA biogenesis protein MshG